MSLQTSFCYFSTLVFFSGGAGSGAVLHLVVPAKGPSPFLSDAEEACRALLPGGREAHTGVGAHQTWLFQCFAPFSSLSSLKVQSCLAWATPCFTRYALQCLVRMSLFAFSFLSPFWLCSPRVSAVGGCRAVGVVTVSWHVFCTHSWSCDFCVFCALGNPLSCCGATGEFCISC